MAEHTEVKSENARNLILSYGENVYFVNKVNVQIHEDNKKIDATFHARKVQNNQTQELNITINKDAYEVLLEYAKLNKLDLILVMHIENETATWCLMDETWLKNQTPTKTNTNYIV